MFSLIVPIADTGGMGFFPPRGRDAGKRWVQDHPWLYGLTTAMIGGEIFVAIALYDHQPPGAAVMAGVLLTLIIWPVLGLMTKRRWGLRPDADSHPDPTVRRPYSSMSRRTLMLIIGLGAFGVVTSVWKLMPDTGDAVTWISLAASAAFVILGFRELSRRRR